MALGGLLPTVKKVNVDRKYTIDELHEILSTKSNIQGLYFQGNGMLRALYAPGIGKYDVNIAPGKKSILLSEYVKKGEGAKDFAASVLTNGITDIVDRNRGIQDVVNEYAAEIERVLN
jgi:hypothetical protein